MLGFGWFLDRSGIRLGYTVSVLFWSIAVSCHALVTTLAGFCVARLFLGLSEGGVYPGATKTVAQWFPKSERAFATSLLNCGANAGALVAPAVVPWLAYTWSWQVPFLVVGAAGLVWVVVWRFVFSAPQEHSLVSPSELALITQDGDQVPAEPGDKKFTWAGLLGYRQTWAYIVAKLLTDPVWYFFLIWLPDFFKKTRGLDIKNSWPHLITVYAIVTALSLCGGYFTGYLIRRNWSVTGARKTGLFCFALLVTPIALVTHVGDWTAVCLIGLAGAAHQAWSANLYTTVSDMFPNRAVASIIGIGSMAGSLGAIAFQFNCGRLLDHYGQSGATQSYALLFGYCSGAYLVAFALNHLLAAQFRPIVSDHASLPSG